MVTRFREYNNSDTRIQEIRITNDKVKWEKVFAFNGWQVLDSVTYNGNEKITYKAEYSEGHKAFEYSKEDSSVQFDIDKNFRCPSKDKYHLSNFYFEDLLVVHRLMGLKTIDTKSDKVIKPNFAPMILTEYGIPHNELLDSCLFSISEEGFIQKDIFYFENFTLVRNYDYWDYTLRKVVISKFNNAHNSTEQIIEKFEIEKTTANNVYDS